MNIAILGAGNVGGSLGKVWSKQGHSIRFGVRNPDSDKTKAALETAPGAKAVSVAEAVAFGDVVVLSTPTNAAIDTVRSIDDWQGKILIDACNRLDGQNHPTAFVEDIAAAAKNARVVKAFNNQGNNIMENPHFGVAAATMFLAGDDESAKTTVSELAASAGFTVVNVGDLSKAYLVEKLAELWVHLAYTRGMGREIAFCLLTR